MYQQRWIGEVWKDNHLISSVITAEFEAGEKVEKEVVK